MSLTVIPREASTPLDSTDVLLLIAWILHGASTFMRACCLVGLRVLVRGIPSPCQPLSKPVLHYALVERG